MLILTRRVGETIIIGEDGEVVVTVLGIKGNQVRVGIKAPKTVSVHREEIYNRIQQEKTSVTASSEENTSVPPTEAIAEAPAAATNVTTVTTVKRKRTESKLDKDKTESKE